MKRTAESSYSVSGRRTAIARCVRGEIEMDIKNDQGLLEAIAETIGETSCFLSKTDLEHALEKAGIVVVDSGARSNGYGYRL